MTLRASTPVGGFGRGQGFGTPAYRHFVLVTLTLVYTLNFIDRVLIGVVAQPIIEEFRLQDWQFGLLSGFGFALMYTLAGIPLARLSERYNRVRIIAASVVVWSAMTALCGLAGSFAALLIFRIGVGIGEAGCTPPANSLIADYFPPRSRARALATYTLGITIGGVLANAFGGPLAEMFSWREAFLVLGVPGILIGIAVLFIVREPPRGYADPPGTPVLEDLGFRASLAELAAKRSYWLNAIAASTVSFAGYGMLNFQAAFFQRSHDLSVAEVATQVAVPLGLTASLGAFGAGYLTERISARYPNAVAWIPGYGLLLAAPIYFLAFSAESLGSAVAFMLLGSILHYSFLGAQYTICQGVVSMRSRATAVALLLFIINLLGYGLGPLAVGLLSDWLMSAELASSPFSAELSVEACKASESALIVAMGQLKAQVCLSASASGLRQSLSWVVFVMAIAGALYLYIARHLQRDLLAKMN
ncbi:MFS transporter [Parahaliea sp. F7430]|uniref:MFS transporter n=1 Tax=Sediminihaliea albiluteola TaxID=2758564 RepID=A0A7W2TVJ0_9GAMM|nr:MFS transporter [Sediminihaliea albiluteola]MBA6412676.1 MFS transporter [Sediminihaliea albiluteola]